MAVEWVDRIAEPEDFGVSGTPAFPYNLFQPIMSRDGVLTALGEDSKVMLECLGADGFDALWEMVWQINRFPEFYTSHTVVSPFSNSEDAEVCNWARHGAACRIIVLPRDERVPSLDTATAIVCDLHRFLYSAIQRNRMAPPAHTRILLVPVVMKFGTRNQSFPMLGYGVHIWVVGYAGQLNRAWERCARALVLVSRLLQQCHTVP